MSNVVNTIKVKWPQLFKPIQGLKADVLNKIVIEREVVPIIFIPGIMGTRLKNPTGKKVWDPDDVGFMVKHYGLVKSQAPQRKALLIGKSFDLDYLAVH